MGEEVGLVDFSDRRHPDYASELRLFVDYMFAMLAWRYDTRWCRGSRRVSVRLISGQRSLCHRYRNLKNAPARTPRRSRRLGGLIARPIPLRGMGRYLPNRLAFAMLLEALVTATPMTCTTTGPTWCP